MPKANLPTIRQKRFIKYYLETGNASQSALKAGYAVRESAFDVLSSPIIKKLWPALLDKHGISDNKLAKVLGEGLNASKTVISLGDEPEACKVADHPTRHKFLTTALELKEKIKHKNGNGKNGDTHFHLTVTLKTDNGTNTKPALEPENRLGCITEV